ncbi:triacylglycerol lipase OBL1-like [Malus domestica]|uniref:triacylglycerol lipase OBL1-like n=1 Tax=Malus domestica TaxID=3750 RepID=UPI0014607F91
MAMIGRGIEICLNLFSSTQNLVGLFKNLLRGEDIVPKKDSRTFLSFIGNLDKRVELDKSIKHGDVRYNAALSMMASKISYENKFYIETTVQDHWKMEFIGSYDFRNDYQGKSTTQACILRDRNADHDIIVVAFRGTEPFDADAWCTDFDISWYQLEGVGKIHGGFMKALGLQRDVGWPEPENIKQVDAGPGGLAYYAIRDMLKKLLLENERAKFIVTGHSLGGALAILFPAVLTFHKGNDSKLLLERLEGVYTFGQPRVGDKVFGEYMEKKMIQHKINYFRFVYGNDLVPRLPYDDKALMFKHFGNCIYSNREYELQVLPEEPNKNYFSPEKVIPMVANVFGELKRSFTIPYMKGPDYKEGRFLKMVRLMGL